MTLRVAAPWLLAAGVLLVFGAVVSLALIGGAAQASCDPSQSPVSAAGEPPLVQIYLAAAERYGLGPDGYAYLAAINKRESSFGTNMATSPPAAAEGWMAFTPPSWQEYGVAIGHAGPPDPFNPYDAIYSAARLLSTDHAPQDWSGALWDYNHAGWYVAEVTAIAHTYLGAGGLSTLNADIRTAWGGREPTGVSRAPADEPVAYQPGAGASASGGCCPDQPAAPRLGTNTTTSSTSTTTRPAPGGHRRVHRGASQASRAPAARVAAPSASTAPSASGAGCSSQTANVLPIPGRKAIIEPDGVARPPAAAPQAVQTLIAAGDRLIHYPYSYAGGHCVAAMDDLQALDQCPGSEENGGAGLDCSGATGWVLWQIPVGKAFLDDSPQASGPMMSEGVAGPGRWVTVFAAGGHAFLGIAGIALDTSWQWHPGTQPATPSTGPRWVPELAAYRYEDQGGGSYTGQYVMRHPTGL